MNSVFGVKMGKEQFLKRLGNIDQVVSIKHLQFVDGKADGVRVFEIRNGGGLNFTILQGKCMDVYDMCYKGVTRTISPNREFPRRCFSTSGEWNS